MSPKSRWLILALLALALLALLAAAPGLQAGRDFYFDVSRGNISNASAVLKFGRNSDVDSAAAEDVWDGGGAWAAPTEARLHLVASTDANDAAAGTGARTIELYGLSAAGLLQQETVTLNGTTDVTTTNTYIMVHRMVVLTAGSGGSNAGDVTATAQTDATVTAQINAGNNQTLMAIYQVPADRDGCLVSVYADMNRSVTSGAADIVLLAQPDGAPWQVKHYFGLVGPGSSHFQHRYVMPNCFAPLTRLKIQASASANNTDISAGFDMIGVQ